MVDAKCASKFTFAKKVIERHPGSNRDAIPELLPAGASLVERVGKMLGSG